MGALRVDGWRSPENIGRCIREFREAVGYPRFTSHVRRHAAATIAAERGLSAREISGCVGHAKPSFTQDNHMDRRRRSGRMSKTLDAAWRPVRR